MILDHEQALRVYRALSGSRRAEQAITDLAKAGVIPGHHSGLGHECIGVAVGSAMSAEDCALLSHRSGMMLQHARGAYTLREAVLACFGRARSFCGPAPGRPRTLPAIGLVGSALPMAVGIALSDQMRHRLAATVAFFGDGAANEGAVHEAINLAGSRRAPVVFVLENNALAISTPVASATAAAELVARAAGYGLPGVAVDGQDVEAMHDAALRELQRARAGLGPSLIEVRLDRWEPHAQGLPDLRSPEQLQQARARDGLALFRSKLLARGGATEAQLDEIDRRCEEDVAAAVVDARQLGLDEAEPAPYDESIARAMAYAS